MNRDLDERAVELIAVRACLAEEVLELRATRELLAHRTADHDAVVAERDAALERVAALEDENLRLREQSGEQADEIMRLRGQATL